MSPVLQPGNLVDATWKARLPDHLGHFTLELNRGYAARFMDLPASLNCLQSAVTLCEAALPEREPHAAIFNGSLALIESLDSEYWGEIYIKWELLLLSELGFGLDLEECAAGGTTINWPMSALAAGVPCRCQPERPIATSFCRFLASCQDGDREGRRRFWKDCNSRGISWRRASSALGTGRFPGESETCTALFFLCSLN
ncbi:DNA repair protein RecO [Fodinicurvata halophila]|uniref:DNA repair protein RecO n=1 Tax=Fodinicurvata halophila TaxID=1419723 RepID=UPI003630E7A6